MLDSPDWAAMKITLKNTILLSTGLAALLNLIQLVGDAGHSSHAYFAPPWALASSANPAPTSNLPVLSKLPPAAASSQAPASQVTTASDSLPVLPSSAASIAATLAAAGLNPVYAPLYLYTQQRTGTPWQLLAAVHETETGQSGNTSRTSYAGAEGPMQFMPATFDRYAMDGNGDGITDITNVDDAVMTAGHYLAVQGAARGDYTNALYGYNHSSSYVSQVISLADRLGL
jgi:soluble lytic murein transglycosylase-like protein